VSEAILLVGGQGTRLRPLTDSTPKPLLPLAGVACTTHQLLKAKAAGVTRVVLATSYLADIFEAQYGAGEDLGLELVYAVEREPLGTGGAIANAGQFLKSDGPILIFNGDVISNHSLEEQYRVHQSSGAVATLHLTPVEDARAYGCVPVDDSGRVSAFLEKMDNPVTNLINAGCYIFNRSIIDAISLNTVISVEREIFPELVMQHVQGFVSHDYWIDLGTPEAFTKASADLITGRAYSPALGSLNMEYLANAAEIAKSARITGGTFLDKGVIVDAGAYVHQSVILADSRVGSNAHVENSFVGRGVKIGPGIKLVNVAVGDGVEINEGSAVPEGARLSV
jgi:mannose-1-phosphate guanylyltransferase